MAKKPTNEHPGYGKLLDAWVPPQEAGDPVGCLATSFTFSPAFFEEECLARFLQLESDPDEDGAVYLIEREEKLAQVQCAAALVDQRHCHGSRSLRWDLLSSRMAQGIQHAKVSLLVWSDLTRLIISSANLTEDGYRRNLELFGVVDFRRGGDVPVSCLRQAVQFLEAAVLTAGPSGNLDPAVNRWLGLLEQVDRIAAGWEAEEQRGQRGEVQVFPVFSGPGRDSVFDQLTRLWPSGPPADVAHVVSPFFDMSKANRPAEKLWELLRQRGEAQVNFHVAGDPVPGEDAVFLQAPASLQESLPATRSGVDVRFHHVTTTASRPLHAKAILLQNARWALYLVGSSNFTSAGTGLSPSSNLEANLVYRLDMDRIRASDRRLREVFPPSEPVTPPAQIQWQPLAGDGEDDSSDVELLPQSFGVASYHCNEQQKAFLTLTFTTMPPAGWVLINDADERRVCGETEWQVQQSPMEWQVVWTADRPPSGLWVRWAGSGGVAWWPVNVTSGHVLPPPEELRNLPLQVLINILSSARPLHRVMRTYLRQQQQESSVAEQMELDPHRRVDTSQFLLQRTRRVSWALRAMRERLERPVVTLEFLHWRLRGPVGAKALADALAREAHSDAERAFLISELVLELSRTTPVQQEGCIPVDQQKAEILSLVLELREHVPALDQSAPENLRAYVKSVFEAVSL